MPDPPEISAPNTIHVRSGHRADVTRKIKAAKALLKQTAITADTINELTALKETLTRKTSVLENLDSEILKHISAPNEIEEAIAESSQREHEIKLSIISINNFLSSHIQTRKFPTLPQIKIPSFNGDPKTFHTFWDLYKSTIHDNPELTDIQKYSYLKSLCVGKAAESISGLRQSEDQYPTLIKTLKDYFEKNGSNKGHPSKCSCELKPNKGHK